MDSLIYESGLCKYACALRLAINYCDHDHRPRWRQISSHSAAFYICENNDEVDGRLMYSLEREMDSNSIRRCLTVPVGLQLRDKFIHQMMHLSFGELPSGLESVKDMSIRNYSRCSDNEAPKTRTTVNSEIRFKISVYVIIKKLNNNVKE